MLAPVTVEHAATSCIVRVGTVGMTGMAGGAGASMASCLAPNGSKVTEDREYHPTCWYRRRPSTRLPVTFVRPSTIAPAQFHDSRMTRFIPAMPRLHRRVNGEIRSHSHLLVLAAGERAIDLVAPRFQCDAQRRR